MLPAGHVPSPGAVGVLLWPRPHCGAATAAHPGCGQGDLLRVFHGQQHLCHTAVPNLRDHGFTWVLVGGPKMSFQLCGTRPVTSDGHGALAGDEAAHGRDVVPARFPLPMTVCSAAPWSHWPLGTWWWPWPVAVPVWVRAELLGAEP